MEINLWHPVVNHFTIALIIFGVFLDIIAKLFRNEKLHFAAWLNLLFGATAGVFTIITGLIAEDHIRQSEVVYGILEKHETIGFVILGLVVIMLMWRFFLRGKFPGRGAAFYILLSVSMVILITINGFYGGEMVFKHGVAVGTKSLTDNPSFLDRKGNSSRISMGDSSWLNVKADSLREKVSAGKQGIPSEE